MTRAIETTAAATPTSPTSDAAAVRPHRRHPARLALLLAVLVLLAAGGYYAWRTWMGPQNPAEDLATAVVQLGDLEDVVTATGTLQPKEFVDVGTQVSGQVKRLLVDVGAEVKAGQLLAEIDPSVYQSKVDAARAQLRNQQAQLADRQAQLALAERQLTRQRNMMREDATTADALQTAEAAQQSAVAQVNSIRAQMQQTESTLRGDEANLGYTKIYAPISGTVVSQAAKQGQTLNANQQAPVVMRIANLATMTVQAQVSEADVPKLKVGMEVYFTTLGGDNRRFYGKLRQISPTPTVVNNVVLYDALFDVDNPDRALMTQMTAQVFFVIASARDAVLVPLSALRPVETEGASRGERGAAGGERESAGGQRGSGSREGRSASGERAPAAAERPAGAGQGRPEGGERVAGLDPRSRFAHRPARVRVVDAADKVSDREVSVGVTSRVFAQILSGLEPGEKVVIGNRPRAPATAPQGRSALTSGPTGGRRP